MAWTFPNSSPVPPDAPEYEDEGTKYTKPEVNYRPAGSSDTNCGNCGHYEGDGICALVAGLIDPGGVSDLYTPRRESLVDLVA